MAKTSNVPTQCAGVVCASANTVICRKTKFVKKHDVVFNGEVFVGSEYTKLETVVPRERILPAINQLVYDELEGREWTYKSRATRKNTPASIKGGFSEYRATVEVTYRDRRGKVTKTEVKVLIYEVRQSNGFYKVTAVYEVTAESLERERQNKIRQQEMSVGEKWTAAFGGRWE